MNTPPRGQAGIGLMMLAIGRKRGFAYFGTGTDAYLSSLAPLVALALVLGTFTMLGGNVKVGLILMLELLIGILTPAVVAHPLCRRWARESAWALYATLLNWTPLVVVLAIAVESVVVKLLVLLGVPAATALPICAALLSIYLMWFQWFIARGALRLTRWRTAGLLLITSMVCYTLMLTPLALGGDLAILIPADTLVQ